MRNFIWAISALKLGREYSGTIKRQGYTLDAMDFERPLHSRNKVNAAGTALIQTLRDIERLEADVLLDPIEAQLEGEALAARYDDALRICNNWRSAHQYPLQVFYMTLRNRARVADSTAIVAQRLKRLSSIIRKLKINDRMMLARIHDLGGCRAILQTVEHVERLVASYKTSSSTTTVFVDDYDYIENPKPTGYRGIHLIYKYHNDSKPLCDYNNLRIEIQLRSRLQHAWATAVETVDTFTEQALKSNIGDDSWKRFFCLMGSALAIKEGCPLVPGTPEDPFELKRELKEYSERLSIQQVLGGWRAVVQIITSRKKSGMDAQLFLLVLHQRKNTISIEPFGKRESLAAQEAYERIEKETAGDPSVQAVLVSVNSIQALPSAYPNYYLDTQAFIRELNEAIA